MQQVDILTVYKAEPEGKEKEELLKMIKLYFKDVYKRLEDAKR